MLDVEKVILIDSDRSVDVPRLLDDALLWMKCNRAAVRHEHLVVASIMRRCIVAERDLAKMHDASRAG